MVKNRYDYQPVLKRKKLEWPGGARLAFWVGPNIEFFYLDKSLPGAPGMPLPDVQAYSLRDYGSRVGVFRLMEVFDKYEMRASVLLNSDVCQGQPEIIAEGKKRNWEWLGCIKVGAVNRFLKDQVLVWLKEEWGVIAERHHRQLTLYRLLSLDD